MPLKHVTETILVVLLGLAVVLAGFAAAVLPSPPAGLVWWGIAAAAAVAYPLLLYPMFKSRRADYPFRVLHFAPLAILLVRFLLEVAGSFAGWVRPFTSTYAWGWTLAAVVPTFLLLAVFCWRVMRQRAMRLRLLAALMLAFLGLAVISETQSWETKITAFLGGESGTGIIVATNGSSSTSRPPVVASAGSSPLVIAQRSAKSGSSSSAPPHLPTSGFGMEAVAVAFAAGYCATLHRRAVRRRIIAEST